jgi:hypothetical protein
MLILCVYGLFFRRTNHGNGRRHLNVAAACPPPPGESDEEEIQKDTSVRPESAVLVLGQGGAEYGHVALGAIFGRQLARTQGNRRVKHAKSCSVQNPVRVGKASMLLCCASD